MKFDTEKLSIDHGQVRRHWHPGSEPYAGADCLLTALDDGWQMEDEVGYREYLHAGVRIVNIYRFDLSRSGETMAMPVIGNPYVKRLIYDSALKIKPVAERELLHVQ